MIDSHKVLILEESDFVKWDYNRSRGRRAEYIFVPLSQREGFKKTELWSMVIRPMLNVANRGGAVFFYDTNCFIKKIRGAKGKLVGIDECFEK